MECRRFEEKQWSFEQAMANVWRMIRSNGFKQVCAPVWVLIALSDACVEMASRSDTELSRLIVAVG